MNQSAAATDPTVVTVNGKQNYIRNFSAEDTIVYEAMEKKSIPALKEVVFLKDTPESWSMITKRHCTILE